MTTPPSRDTSSSGTKPSPAPSTPPSTTSTADTTTASLPSSYVSDKPESDSSKLKLFLGILRKFIGVSDIASVRFSLPAQLLEPTPNLEYWNYLDRPETFAGIGDSDDGLGRMLAVLRFWFTKDLCNWEVRDNAPSTLGKENEDSTSNPIDNPDKKFRVSYLTEQTSHHPPVSAFFVDCPAKGLTARGFDQLSAKFTGTSVRVTPGIHNLGIFINLKHRDNEEYQLTHPTAHLGGLIRGSLSVTVADQCFISCPKTRTKVILHYLEESWLGKTQNRVNGVIFTYDPEQDNRTRIKDVPEKDILCKIEGCWHDQIYYTLSKSKESNLLIDLQPLYPLAKIVPPLDQQLPNESQRFWASVTKSIKSKHYSEATRLKTELEERQRQKAAQRKEKNDDWKPRFFVDAITSNGRPELTEEGKKAVQGLQSEQYLLAESEVTGA